MRNNKTPKRELGEDLISIIIPLYNTNPDIFKRCIQSIEKQDYKNIEIIIVDDCSTENYGNLIKFYKQNLNINYTKLDNNFGPGVARKVGLELAKGDYITFIDSDDEFYDNTSIIKLLTEFIKNPNLNMVSGLAYEELENKKMKLRERNFIWVFGKLFKKKFLDDNHLTFNETRANEDNGFTTLFRMLTDNYIFIDEVVYLWRYEPNSITRINGHEYYFYSIEGYVNNMIWVYEECKKRGLENGKKQKKHFINVWIRLYFYCIEVLFDRDAYDANLLSCWCYNYYNSVYKYIENNIDFDTFLESWNLMVSSSPDTFIKRVINISYPDFYSIISTNKRLID
jgi:glycosyltransferase involved in cell wall biosynthesis